MPCCTAAALSLSQTHRWHLGTELQPVFVARIRQRDIEADVLCSQLQILVHLFLAGFVFDILAEVLHNT